MIISKLSQIIFMLLVDKYMSQTHKFNKQANQQLHRRQETKHNRSDVSEASENTDKKIYITVPYDDRTTAKMLGAKWCEEMRSWFCLENLENAQQLIRRYPYVERTYLYVSYDDKDVAKSMGAYYCGLSKRWYAPRPSEQKDLINRFGSLPKITNQSRSKPTPKPIPKLVRTTSQNISNQLIDVVSPNEIEISA